jgi:hypothetical protein
MGLRENCQELMRSMLKEISEEATKVGGFYVAVSPNRTLNIIKLIVVCEV